MDICDTSCCAGSAVILVVEERAAIYGKNTVDTDNRCGRKLFHVSGIVSK